MELSAYAEHFEGAHIYLNCDNPNTSNFWKYFHINFSKFKLARLTATYYNADNQSTQFDYFGDNDCDITHYATTTLVGNGDFRSNEGIELLKEADIIITNPPFSLFREYITTLFKYNKKFIVMGNMNAVTTNAIFPLFKDNLLWYGHSIHSGDVKFYVPDDYPLEASTCGVDKDGRKYIRVKGIRWFTNIDYKNRHTPLICSEVYSPIKYVKYDNYDAININKTSEIPLNYCGEMGVPITFLDKYCPEQFEIVGNSSSLAVPIHTSQGKVLSGRFYIDGKRLYDRIVVRYTDEWIKSHDINFKS